MQVLLAAVNTETDPNIMGKTNPSKWLKAVRKAFRSPAKENSDAKDDTVIGYLFRISCLEICGCTLECSDPYHYPLQMMTFRTPYYEGEVAYYDVSDGTQ